MGHVWDRGYAWDLGQRTREVCGSRGRGWNVHKDTHRYMRDPGRWGTQGTHMGHACEKYMKMGDMHRDMGRSGDLGNKGTGQET